MSSVFTPCVGGIHKVVLNCNDGSTVASFKIDATGLNAPVTGFALELQGNYQFLHTVNEFIYLYVFGDRVGELVLTGMGFFGACPNDGVQPEDVCSSIGYYLDHRIAKRKEPITISLGNCLTLLGFLTGMRIESTRPESSIAQWVLRFNVLLQD